MKNILTAVFLTVDCHTHCKKGFDTGTVYFRQFLNH